MNGRTSRTESTLRSTLVSPIGSGGLRARLVRASADAAYPFVVVHEGRFARILLAELVGDDGVAQARFAWKLRVDEVAAGDAASVSAPSNGELDRTWQQERAELQRVQSAHVVAPVAVPNALRQSPPVFYCRRIDSYFHPVCPDTGAVLRVCRDADTLKAAGLPPYDEDTARYLHHGRADGPLVFYRSSEVVGSGHSARIADHEELVRGWARLAHGEEPSPDLPCQTCEHRADCYPEEGGAPPALQHLHVISFYDVDALALELAASDFDTAIERLGSRGPTDGAERAWWNDADVGARALESARLKLAAFADVCRGVQAVHDSGRPHLGVSPANVVVFDGVGNSALPANWRLRFALTDLGGARPVRVPGSGDREVLWQPGREVSEDEGSRCFLAPLLRSLEGGSVTMAVACRSAGEGDDERLIVEAHRAGVPSFVLPGDLLVVQPMDGGETVSARVEDVGARGLVATVISNPDPKRVSAGQSVEARLSFVRRSGPSADLYGLGMLLLRMLLVHDEQSLAEVGETVEACLQQMGANNGGEPALSLADRWLEILDGDTGQGRFASWHVVHSRADRQVLFDAELQGRTVIPRATWRRLMTLAGKLLFASPLTPRDETATDASPVRDVLLELAAIERQLDVELFGVAARDRVVASVCAQRLVSLRAEPATKPSVDPDADGDDDGGAGEAGPGPEGTDEGETQAGSGFVLAVGRVGESGIRQYHFSQERVTIGRREEDNLLCLTDPMVSSKHALIEWEGGEFVVSDRGSTNGTEVDGIRLPVEVPHPLDDGSVIHIRPFMLSFRLADVTEPVLEAAPVLGAEELFEQLRTAYAEAAGGAEQQVHQALSVTLDRVQKAIGRQALAAALEAVLKQFDPTERDAQLAAADPESELANNALACVRRLASELGVAGELASPSQVMEFSARLAQFTGVSSQWLSRLLASAGARTPMTSGDLRRRVLTPDAARDPAQSARDEVEAMYRQVVSALEMLLQGSLTSLVKVRERLDPDNLVTAAGGEARIRLLMKATTGSVLWKTFESTFAQVAGKGDVEALLRRWLGGLDDRGR